LYCSEHLCEYCLKQDRIVSILLTENDIGFFNIMFADLSNNMYLFNYMSKYF
jgi:hypothetical protein